MGYKSHVHFYVKHKNAIWSFASIRNGNKFTIKPCYLFIHQHKHNKVLCSFGILAWSVIIVTDLHFYLQTEQFEIMPVSSATKCRSACFHYLMWIERQGHAAKNPCEDKITNVINLSSLFNLNAHGIIKRNTKGTTFVWIKPYTERVRIPYPDSWVT